MLTEKKQNLKKLTYLCLSLSLITISVESHAGNCFSGCCEDGTKDKPTGRSIGLKSRLAFRERSQGINEKAKKEYGSINATYKTARNVLITVAVTAMPSALQLNERGRSAQTDNHAQMRSTSTSSRMSIQTVRNASDDEKEDSE